MSFVMHSSPNDEKLFDKKKESVFTLGRGSYTSTFDISLQFYGNVINVLGGRFCSLADNIYFSMGGNHPLKSVSSFPFDVFEIVKNIFGKACPDIHSIPRKRKQHRQIIFGHDVWIARNVTIMGGVKIGNGAVIGANATVAKNIPPYAIAVGNPARVIKYRFDRETIRKFLAVKWWNWSLEKIADNFPLMNDPEKFLEAHYSPELEKYPEDDFSKQLKTFKGASYNFIPDFEATNPLWLKVIKDFKQADLSDAVLVIWLGKETTDENFKALSEAIGDSKNILTFKHEENFSPTALRRGTHFITTREMSSLEALDYLWDTDVKIVSALDAGIFKSPPVKPVKGTNLITPDDMLNFGDLDYLWNR